MSVWAVEITYWDHSGVAIVEAETEIQAVDQAIAAFVAERPWLSTEKASIYVDSHPKPVTLPYLWEGINH